MTYEQIQIERLGAVQLVTLHRPERMNAWTWQMAAELLRSFSEADADDDIRAIVVTGHGNVFCAGADLGGGEETFSGRSGVVGTVDHRQATRMAVQARQTRTPIIAAINGAAVGAGLTQTMAWDLRVAAEDAKLGFVFNRRGIMPDADLLWTIPRMIGYGAAMDVLLTGRIFSGAEGRELGLINRAVPKGDVLDTAMAMANDIAENTAPVSVAITKRLMYDFLTRDWPEADRLQRELFAWTGKQADAREGVAAFLERRPAKWKMSKTKDMPAELAALPKHG